MTFALAILVYLPVATMLIGGLIAGGVGGVLGLFAGLAIDAVVVLLFCMIRAIVEDISDAFGGHKP